jgi:hypothetical protein
MLLDPVDMHPQATKARAEAADKDKHESGEELRALSL